MNKEFIASNNLQKMQKTLKYITAVVLTISLFTACQQPGVNSTGSEYMPDMAHSVAYEANYYSYYYYNTWGTEDEYYQMASPRTPVAGTIPRTKGSSSVSELPYPYANTEEDRAKAMAEIINNPIPISTAGLEEGKALYEVNCGLCHGNKGDGLGYLVREDGGKYPAAPANFLLEEHLLASNGRYYHAIMHGRNLMGAYKDKLSYEERWNVIHYIRSLQAKETKKEYNQFTNTFNNDKVLGDATKLAMNMHNADHNTHMDSDGAEHMEGMMHDENGKEVQHTPDQLENGNDHSHEGNNDHGH